MKHTGAPRIFRLVKLGITAALLAWLVSRISFADLAEQVTRSSAIYLALGTLLLALNDAVVAMRWWLLLRRIGAATVSLGYIVAATYAGAFVGQLAPGPIGADAARGWLCHRRGVASRTIVVSLVADRSLALLGYIAVALTAASCHVAAIGTGTWRELAFVGAGAVGLAVTTLWVLPAMTAAAARRRPRWQAVDEAIWIFRSAALSLAGGLGTVLSCLVVGLTVNAVMLLSRGVGFALEPSVAYLVVPIAILFAALPVSIGGWGVREASMSYGFMLFGTSAHDASLTAVALGIGLLLASLPGGVAVLMLGPGARPASRGAMAGGAASADIARPALDHSSRDRAPPQREH